MTALLCFAAGVVLGLVLAAVCVAAMGLWVVASDRIDREKHIYELGREDAR